MPTVQATAELDIAENDEALEINLDLIEEKREQAAIREAKSKRQMEKYYNTKVRNTSFKPGDLVYRSNEASRVEDTGKLGPKWEGPYEVTEALGKGSYKLKDRNGKEVPRTWNLQDKPQGHMRPRRKNKYTHKTASLASSSNWENVRPPPAEASIFPSLSEPRVAFSGTTSVESGLS
ncbi:hypothetical protein Tco_0910208 [Tanacetum coccineum]|uniref:Reverse transcriptase domain-containing protein n=1 Tax=Tanacetum coccineum TaxID=301880 RepID=A0ABQ5CSL8_9ASTR